MLLARKVRGMASKGNNMNVEKYRDGREVVWMSRREFYLVRNNARWALFAFGFFCGMLLMIIYRDLGF
jgi:hypothetical protein